MEKRLILILGGARSGKSKFAQRLAEQTSQSVLYVATAQASDTEMEVRIATHQKDRPEYWATLEAFSGVGNNISAHTNAVDVVILDCLTLLTNNVIFALPEPIENDLADQLLKNEIDDLMQCYRSMDSMWIIISNEVGSGLVPAYPLGRVYRDVLGKANQRLADEADTVIFMVAGLPMVLKGKI